MIKVLFISIDAAERIISNTSLGLFQEPFWWKTIENGFNKRCKIALVSKDGINQLLIPLFFHKIGFLHRVGMPLRGTYTPYMDFVKLSEEIDNEIQEECLLEVVDTLLKEGVNWIEITCLFEKESIYKGLENVGFFTENPSTIILNTNKSEEELWLDMQGRARNLVRKAEKNELSIEFLDYELKNIEVFYSMLENTFIKSGQRPPHSKDFYILLVKELIISGNLLFVSIQKDMEVVAMGIFMYNHSEMNFMSGTSTRVGNKYGANNLMHWEVIKFASKNNIKKYNFGGLGIPSIDKFKRSFGGYETGYIRYVWMKTYVYLLFNVLTWVKTKLVTPFRIWINNH
jgi:lipid II:glycine glycyltransferase (peptidoglycan interpeptide bridge formation enzyme)